MSKINTGSYYTLPLPPQIAQIQQLLQSHTGVHKVSDSALFDILVRTCLNEMQSGTLLAMASHAAIKILSCGSPLVTNPNFDFNNQAFALQQQLVPLIHDALAPAFNEMIAYGSLYINTERGKINFSQAKLNIC